MSNVENWRSPVDAEDFFGSQKKRSEMASRRPVPTKPSDLGMGPAMNIAATRITDFNDPLALCDGYFAADVGALHAPNDTEAFAGTVVMDTFLGGEQRFRSLSTGIGYTRLVIRNPADPSSLSFSAWISDDPRPASVFATDAPITTLLPSVDTDLIPPALVTLGESGTFLRESNKVRIVRPGVYTGYLRVAGVTSTIAVTFDIEYPEGDQIYTETRTNVGTGSGISVPLHFWASDSEGFVRLSMMQDGATEREMIWERLALSRISDI